MPRIRGEFAVGASFYASCSIFGTCVSENAMVVEMSVAESCSRPLSCFYQWTIAQAPRILEQSVLSSGNF